MPSANVDLVRTILAANGRGDYSSTAWARPDIEFVIADGPSPGSWSGLAGMSEAWHEFASAWESFSTSAQEYRKLHEERVLVLIHRSGRGKRSGLELQAIGSEGAGLFHVRDGKVKRLVVYMERERAFADLGLPPDAAS